MQPERRAHGKKGFSKTIAPAGLAVPAYRLRHELPKRGLPTRRHSGKMGRLVLDRTDRLLRFGAELVSQLAKSAASHG
jgi:hypothetical protein